jgi:hypothetical protein
MSLPENIDPERLRRQRPFPRFFRYRLHRDDFQPVKRGRRVLGYMTAKPLYGKLTAEGRVDRSGGFNGRIAVIFVPTPASGHRPPRLLFARLPRRCITRPDGRRNWPVIRAAARTAVLQYLYRNRNELKE